VTGDCAPGSPGGLDCGDVLTWLPAYLDGEMTSAEAAHFREHVEACSPCLQELGIDQVVKALVGRCCGGEAAPQELRNRVVTGVRASYSITAMTSTTIEIHTES
jgi:anti-sigma factor (TIGR02949 family)